MNGETAQNPFPTSADQGANGGAEGGKVHKVAQKVHSAVDTLEQKIGSGSEKVMGLQQEYGDMAREQVRASPLAAVGIAFAAGYIFARIIGGGR